MKKNLHKMTALQAYMCIPHFIIPEAGGQVREAKAEAKQDNEHGREQGMATYREYSALFLEMFGF
jgi:hypothetical protein